MVVFAHSYALTDHKAPLIHVGRYAMGLGSLGVAIFFVSSGFLVSESWDRTGRLGAFARSRFARIWPALTLLVVGLVFFVGPVLTTLGLRQYFSNALTFRYLWKNVTLVSGVSFNLPGVFVRNQPVHGVDGSLWTLQYEIWAYVALMALGLAGALRRPYVALVVLITALVVFRLGIPGGIITLPRRAVLGMTLERAAWLAAFFFAGVVLSRIRGMFDLRKIVVPAVALVALAFFTREPALYVVGVAALVVGLGMRQSAATRAVHRLGDPSYGVYIYSFPLMQLIYRAQVADTPLAMFSVAAPLALVAGYISWWLVERPALNLLRGPAAREAPTVQGTAVQDTPPPSAASVSVALAADTRVPAPPPS
jgi:peptidoglycan/LPS O-acetylase OafA/YrhL